MVVFFFLIISEYLFTTRESWNCVYTYNDSLHELPDAFILAIFFIIKSIYFLKVDTYKYYNLSKKEQEIAFLRVIGF